MDLRSHSVNSSGMLRRGEQKAYAAAQVSAVQGVAVGADASFIDSSEDADRSSPPARDKEQSPIRNMTGTYRYISIISPASRSRSPLSNRSAILDVSFYHPFRLRHTLPSTYHS